MDKRSVHIEKPQILMDMPPVQVETKKRKTFMETDELSGWPVSEQDSRVGKYVRHNVHQLKNTVLSDRFVVSRVVVLPDKYLVDPDASEETNSKDRGDIYEAFQRTSQVSVRGIFANGEAVWGTVHYRCGIVYTGALSAGVAHGFGEKRAGESVYKGNFHKGMRHGKGCLLDSKYYRLFLGMFKDDMPHGEVLMIMFGWSMSNERAYTSHSLVTFQNGQVVKKVDTSDGNNAQGRSGLHPEEFMEMFRMGEKLVEETTSRKRLAAMNAEESLCTPFGVYPFSH
jgi:hypothetical protein